jgi:hypothetical protein
MPSLCCLAILVQACAGDVGHSATRDSAGIRIIENATPAWTAGDAQKLSATPALVIGTQDGASYELSRISGAARLSDGRIVIADGASRQLRFFDSTGHFLNVVGGRGQGPGEFRDLDVLHHLRGDTLIAGRETGSVAVFSGDGRFLRDVDPMRPWVRLPPGIPGTLGWFNTERALVSRVARPAPHQSGARWIDSGAIAISDPDSAASRHLGAFPWWDATTPERGRSSPRFGAALVAANNERWFFVGYGTEYSIRVYSAAGDLERIITRRWTPVRITSADVDHFVTEWAKSWTGVTDADAERRKQAIRDDPRAETIPAFARFMADRIGRLWVREAHPMDEGGAGWMGAMPVVPSVWSVFDADGRWLGDVTMPAQFLPAEIGADYVLGMGRGREGVETVVIYRIVSGSQ